MVPLWSVQSGLWDHEEFLPRLVWKWLTGEKTAALSDWSARLIRSFQLWLPLLKESDTKKRWIQHCSKKSSLSSVEIIDSHKFIIKVGVIGFGADRRWLSFSCWSLSFFSSPPLTPSLFAATQPHRRPSFPSLLLARQRCDYRYCAYNVDGPGPW